MMVLGFDPGSSHTGWCAIDVRGGGTLPVEATYFDAGTVPSACGDVALLLRRYPEVVAVEKLAGYAFGAGKGPGVVAGLVASSWVAGLISALAWSEGLATEEMTAMEWRKRVLGKPSASDQQIAVAIPAAIHGWPKRSNVHVRDAAGVALAVAMKLNGRKP